MSALLSRRSALTALAGLASACGGPRLSPAVRAQRYPVATRTLRVPGGHVAYADLGRGDPTLLLIHGLASSLGAWTRNLAPLAARHRVIAVDLPGYGRSSGQDVPGSMAYFADVIDGVITALRLRDVVLVGHSMGGQIALTHALRHPGRARALVLCAPAGFEVFDEREAALLKGATTPQAIMATPPERVRANVAANFVTVPDDARFIAEDRLRLIGDPGFSGYATAVSRSVAGMLDGPVFARLPEIQAPTLVLFGEEDRLIPNRLLHRDSTTSDVAERGAAQLPRGRLLKIPQAGHFVMLEQGARVNEEILGFVGALP